VVRNRRPFYGGEDVNNIILTLIGYVPGIIHAFWIVSKEAENS
jgi:uncharacterized membrane protein YqaE (UPF0057 family)